MMMGVFRPCAFHSTSTGKLRFDSRLWSRFDDEEAEACCNTAIVVMVGHNHRQYHHHHCHKG